MFCSSPVKFLNYDVKQHFKYISPLQEKACTAHFKEIVIRKFSRPNRNEHVPEFHNVPFCPRWPWASQKSVYWINPELEIFPDRERKLVKRGHRICDPRVPTVVNTCGMSLGERRADLYAARKRKNVYYTSVSRHAQVEFRCGCVASIYVPRPRYLPIVDDLLSPASPRFPRDSSLPSRLIPSGQCYRHRQSFFHLLAIQLLVVDHRLFVSETKDR